jgi:hypothetical protein
MTHGGLIDKFIGDCIMAVWGAPFAIGNQETRGALCAAMMERETRVAPLSDEFDAAGESLHVRVGVATGTVRAGNMGTSERMNYTVIGDDVNLAARLESLNKQFNTRVLLAQSTAERVAPVLALRLVHRIRVVGKDAPVEVYDIVGFTCSRLSSDLVALLRGLDDSAPSIDSAADHASVFSASTVNDVASDAYAIRVARKGSSRLTTSQLLEAALRLPERSGLAASPEMLRRSQLHTDAVQRFAASQFAEAMSLLGELEQLMSDCELDTAARILRDECEHCLKDPPGPDFNGVFRCYEA